MTATYVFLLAYISALFDICLKVYTLLQSRPTLSPSPGLFHSLLKSLALINMATQAHCAYCFEVISATFEKRKPLSLASVEDLWTSYETEADEEDIAMEDYQQHDTTNNDFTPASASRLPAINRLLSPNSSSASSSSAPSASSSTPSLHTNASSNTSVSSRTSERGGLLGLAGRLTRSKRRSASHAEECPLFVTWDIRGRSGNKSLRGCIGTFEAQELDDGLRSYALTSYVAQRVAV